MYPESLALVRQRVTLPLVLVDEGRFPPLAPGYSLLSLFDVLEHIDDDEGTLVHLREVLEPGGILVLTVPAHPFLFDEMDEIAHHRRRYTPRGARGQAPRGRLRVLHLHSWPRSCRWCRCAGRLRALGGRKSAMKRRKAELSVTPGLNGLMRALLRLERPLGARGRLPFGTSLVAVAARPL